MCLKLASFHAARLILRLIIVYQAYLIVLTQQKKQTNMGFVPLKMLTGHQSVLNL